MKKFVKKILLPLFLAGAVLAACVGLVAYDRYVEQGPNQEVSLFYIAPGESLRRTAQRAEDAGLIANKDELWLWARITGRAGAIRAGEYAVPAHASLKALLWQFTKGEHHRRYVTIVEGLSSYEVWEVLLLAEGLKAPEMDAINIQDIPEGSILPETYDYQYGETLEALTARMQAALKRELDAAWLSRAPDLPFDSKEDALILASIIEKETGLADERDLVAAVFINRLRRGMRLQSDPTVLYGIGLGKPYEGNLTRADLQEVTPYNTYRINGLPPTPIAHAGKASIHAALHPADVPYLYFVADGTGGHAFAVTLEEHNKNVARWRRIERQTWLEQNGDTQ